MHIHNQFLGTGDIFVLSNHVKFAYLLAGSLLYLHLLLFPAGS